MDFQNETGLPAKIFRGQPEPDIMLATVVAKVSFLIQSDTVQQLDVAGVDVYEEDLETPFGYLPNDMVPLKPGVDLFVLGKAYAPGQRPAERMEVSFRLGSLERRLLVVGDRQWRTPQDATSPQPFLEMPVTYANAYGGETEIQGSALAFPNNPLGKGFILEKDMAPGKPLPNIESPAQPIKCWEDQPTPAGFAPFPRPTRITAERSIKIIDAAALRYEFVPQVFLAAHPDMVVPELVPGSACVLNGMTRQGVLRFRVPDVRIALAVTLGDKQCRFPMRTDTLCVLPEDCRVVLTNRASFRYRFVPEQARTTVLKWEGTPLI